jgi:hypothetical protein
VLVLINYKKLELKQFFAVVVVTGRRGHLQQRRERAMRRTGI